MFQSPRANDYTIEIRTETGLKPVVLENRVLKIMDGILVTGTDAGHAAVTSQGLDYNNTFFAGQRGVNLQLVYLANREELRQFPVPGDPPFGCQMKTADGRGTLVVVVDKPLAEELHGRRWSDRQYTLNVAHEMAHGYQDVLFHEVPWWLHEGLANAVTGSAREPNIRHDVRRCAVPEFFSGEYTRDSSNWYGSFVSATRTLLQTYGKDKVFAIAACLSSFMSPEEMEQEANRVLGTDDPPFGEVIDRWLRG